LAGSRFFAVSIRSRVAAPHQTQVADFYDQFAAEQRRKGLNARIWHLYGRLRHWGFSADSRVLELGCGIGALTFLMARDAVRGYIEAVDLSPASVRFAGEQLGQRPNLSLHVHDVVTYQPTRRDFDLITLFDVIEHIPLDLHAALCQQLATIVCPQTTILINIPHPALIAHYRRHDPSALQVVDQSVELAPLIQHLQAAGLVLHALDTYSLWREDDYQFLVIRPRTEFTDRAITATSLGRRIEQYIQRKWRNATARYPR
jgi:trans-aconitate 2-methyltransferase